MLDGFLLSSSVETQQQIPVKPISVHFVTYPKQGFEMEAVGLHREGFLANFFP